MCLMGGFIWNVLVENTFAMYTSDTILREREPFDLKGVNDYPRYIIYFICKKLYLIFFILHECISVKDDMFSRKS